MTDVPSDSELPDKKRRARYPFVANVKIEHLSLGAMVEGITTDLSEGGCGVRVSELFTSGAKVMTRITKDGITFATPATVAYSLPSMAMGLVFGDMPPDQKQILVSWLRAAIPTIRRNAGEQLKV
jgi:PilZ domain